MGRTTTTALQQTMGIMFQPRRCLTYVYHNDFAGGGSGAWVGSPHSNLYIIVAGSGDVMGRIKTDMIKRTASKLVKTYPDKFTKDFGKNKEALADLAEIRSKKLRNIIAGQVVRLKTQGEDAVPRVRKKTFTPQRGDFQRRSFDSRR